MALIILLPGTVNLFAGYCAEALSFSNSFSTRARGAQANYWNPANHSYELPHNRELLLFNTYLSIKNNSFSIRKYNELNGTYLTELDKQEIVDDLRGSLRIDGDFSYAIGASFNNFAITGSFNAYAAGRISSKYAQLLLFGNEYEHVYKFDKRNTNFNLLAYSDITYGQSAYSFDFRGYTVNSGFAVSLLSGLASIETTKFDSEFYTSDEGINLDQKIAIRRGSNGTGFKGMIGFISDIEENITLSMTLDNLFAFIRWNGDNEVSTYTANMEGAYLAHLDEDIIESSEHTKKTGSFTTNFYPVINIGAQYRYKNLSFSIDGKQGFGDSVLSNKTPEIGMGFEINAIPIMPLRMGFSPGIGDKPYSVSYGLALLTRNLQVSMGVNSVRAIIPCSYSRGVSAAMTTKWSF